MTSVIRLKFTASQGLRLLHFGMVRAQRVYLEVIGVRVARWRARPLVVIGIGVGESLHHNTVSTFIHDFCGGKSSIKLETDPSMLNKF